jgi:hypothetical protein
MTHQKSLSAVLRKHAPTIQASEASYQQDVLDVCNCMSGIMAAALPLLNTLPANWAEIQNSYTQARSDALSWTNEVYGQLASTPHNVETYNTTLSALFDDAVKQADTLVANPNNSTAKTLLTADLTNIQSTLALINIFITSTQNSIDRFGSQTLSDAATSLQLVSYDAYEDYDIDQQKINDLKQQISDLQAEIVELAVEIGINAALVATEVTVGYVWAASLGPAGLILIGCSVAASATVIGLDAAKLVADQAALQVAQAELTATEQDATALQTTSDSFTTLANQTTALDTSIAGIASAWQALESDMTTAITDVNQAIVDEETTDFSEVYNDLVAAQAAWNEAYSASQLLYINVQGNPAQLNISMSQTQVSSALGQEPTVDFVHYIDNFPQPS